ncbi:toprim domain-containing protein, partial [bacterium]|nr:toprim domain-containing protein [bacterium]
MTKLLIVESPAKAKTIAKYLNDIPDQTEDFVVTSSVGHVRDLPKSNKKAIDIEAGFVPHYEISKGKDKVIAEIKTKAKKANEVLLATDPDREGEAIAWHLKEVLGLKNPKRIVFNEITKDAVQEAIKHPREIDDKLRKAQEARRILDRLVGYDLSGLIWKKVRYGLSAGRVQSPSLRIIMEREREIRAFIPEDFWVITADVKNKSNSEFPLTCSDEPREEKEMQRIMDAGKKGAWNVT